MSELDKVIDQIESHAALYREQRLRAEIERLRELKTPASRELINITKGCWDNAEAEIERLRNILRRLVDKIHDYECINNLAPNPGRTECWDEVAEARRALEGK